MGFLCLLKQIRNTWMTSPHEPCWLLPGVSKCDQDYVTSVEKCFLEPTVTLTETEI
jgi:hypothetical protein